MFIFVTSNMKNTLKVQILTNGEPEAKIKPKGIGENKMENIIIVKGVEISKLVELKKSYSSKEEVLNFAYAKIVGDKIYCLNTLGFQSKLIHKTAKVFRKITYKSEITELQLNKEIATTEKEIAKNNKIKLAETREEELRELLSNNLISIHCNSSILENIEKIKSFISKNEIENRLNGKMESNELCNRAIGFVGYKFAKLIGWITVLRLINDNL